MKRKNLRYNKVDSLKSLHFQILKSLKLNKTLSDTVDFEKRIQTFFSNNPNAQITLELSLSNVYQNIREKKRIELLQQPYPDNFEIGNPLNRWIDSGIVRTEEEAQKDDLKIDKLAETEFGIFKIGLQQIEKYMKVTRID